MRRPRRKRLHGDGWKRSEQSERSSELRGPGPAQRNAQSWTCHERLTRRPGTQTGNGCAPCGPPRAGPVGVTSPSMAVQRMRSWARTAHRSQAAFAEKLPEGTWERPDPSFRSLMASSTVAWYRWKASRSMASPPRSVTKPKCRQSGQSCRLGTDEPGPSHDEPSAPCSRTQRPVPRRQGCIRSASRRTRRWQRQLFSRTSPSARPSCSRRRGAPRWRSLRSTRSPSRTS